MLLDSFQNTMFGFVFFWESDDCVLMCVWLRADDKNHRHTLPHITLGRCDALSSSLRAAASFHYENHISRAIGNNKRILFLTIEK